MSLLKKFQKEPQTPTEPALSPFIEPKPAPFMEAVPLTDPNSIDSSVRELSLNISGRILAALPPGVMLERGEETMRLIRDGIAALQVRIDPSSADGEVLLRLIENEVAGYGPIEPFLEDDSVSEVMVNGTNNIFIEKSGRVTETGIRFANEEHLMRTINRIIVPLGRNLSEKWPMVDGRLPDGSRVNIVSPPCSIHGSTITIRKFSRTPFEMDDLVRFGTLTPDVAEFIRACVVARLNMVVSGGTGTGKTTFLNVLSSFIPDHERIVTIEDAAEIQLHQRHVVTLEARPADPDGTGRVAVRDLVVNALRMRPDRIIVGECRSGEALDMLQAMNTGHEGSLTTIHANTPRDCLSRIETLVLMSGMDLPLKTIRYQMASALDLILQMTRLRDGRRIISQVSEVQGMEGDVVVMQDVFTLVQDGVNPDGSVRQHIQAAGTRPKFMPKIEGTGIHLPSNIFGY